MNYTNVYGNQRQRDRQRAARVRGQLGVRTAVRPAASGSAPDANGLVDRIIGNWSFQGVARLQSGRMLDFGNVRLVGMTANDLRNSFQIRKVTDPANQYRTLVYMLPQDIIDNTIKAYSVNATGLHRWRADGPLLRARQLAGLSRDPSDRLRRLRRPQPHRHRAEGRTVRLQPHQADQGDRETEHSKVKPRSLTCSTT